MTILSERSIEIPWTMERLRGTVIDIGSSSAVYLSQLPPGSYLLDQRPLTEPVPDTLKFLQSDARAIPLQDNTVDTVLCLSTYEHFGKAHDPYGTVAEDYELVAQQCLAEMWRLVRPGGQLILTLPFGPSEQYSWLRVFSYDDLLREFASIWYNLTEIEFFRYSRFLNTYYSVPPDECKEGYDMEVKRSRGLVCMVFTKNTSVFTKSGE